MKFSFTTITVLVFFSLVLVLQAFGQRDIKPTDSFTVTGRVKKELKFNLDDFNKYLQQKIKDLQITKHDGTDRGTMRKLKGIPIIELLKQVEFDAEQPKDLSEYYLIFEGSDGYKLVYSWNEIFNAKDNNGIFIVTEKDDWKLKDIKERIIVITPKDFRTGRRYLKGLSRIIVKRIE